jgi:uridine monophosphate synthetase
MNSLQTGLASLLLELGVVQFGDFRLKAHREGYPNMDPSPFFINLRTADDGGPLLLDQAREIGFQTGLIIAERVPALLACPPKFLAGIMRAGGPLAEGMISVFPEGQVNLLYIAKTGGKESGYGEVKGTCNSGDAGFLVDDVVTDSKSKEQANVVMRECGLTSSGCIVVVDREAGGAEKMAKAGIPIHAAFTLTNLMTCYRDQGAIDDAMFERIMGYGAYQQSYMAANPPVLDTSGPIQTGHSLR